MREYSIKDRQSETGQQNQNLAVNKIGHMKRTSNAFIDRTDTPEFLWYPCMLYGVYLLNHIAVKGLDWRTPIEVTTGENPDISNLIQFQWYEKVHYHGPVASFPDSKEKLGRFVGIAENVGDTLTYKILTEDTNQVICRLVVFSAEKALKFRNQRAEREEETDLKERN